MKKIKQKKYSMLSFVSKYSFVFILAFSMMMPVIFANATGEGVTVDAHIENPLDGSINTLPQFVEAVINVVLIIGIPILVLAIIYAGFLFVKAQGNSGELEIAKNTLLYTVIGGVLLLGAFVIANAIGKTVEDIKSTT